MRIPVVFAIMTLTILPAGGARESSEPSFQDRSSIAIWTDRLEQLQPTDPLAYYELAEEVADLAADQMQRDLARRLFALAGILDSPRLGRSASLALISLETRPHVKRRLQAMASLLGGDTPAFNFLQGETRTSIDPAIAMNVSEAFSYYRRGLGRRALAKLDDEESLALLGSLDSVLRGGSKRFLEDCKLYDRNRQVRPSLSEPNLTKMLQVERALLAGLNRGWTSELLLTDGAPLIEIDTQRLDILLDVDAHLCLYRDGRWVRADE
jgi:hypothetical protein